MKKFIILLLLICLIALPVNAMEFSAPMVPESAESYFPRESTSFWKDLWYIIQQAFAEFNPNICTAANICGSVLVITILVSISEGIAGSSGKTIDLAGTIGVSITLLTPANALVDVGTKTVETMSEYGKLLLPVMTASLAAEGGTATSAALYTGTVLFNTILCNGITKLLIPMLYAFLALGIAKAAIDAQVLKNLQGFAKWLITWTLKISIYLFTGYLGITGVVSGTVDAAAVKATKLAVSGSVPVVGSIISDASEAILVSVGIMKNAVGTYGVLAIFAIWIGPFLQIGAQYILLKITSAVSGILGSKRIVSLIDSFCAVMGFLAAMTGTMGLLLLISTVCYMKGVG